MKSTVVPLEAILRGYLVGALLRAFFLFLFILLPTARINLERCIESLYMPVNIKDGQKLEKPFTPSTKAEQSAQGENILSPGQG